MKRRHLVLLVLISLFLLFYPGDNPLAKMLANTLYSRDLKVKEEQPEKELIRLDKIFYLDQSQKPILSAQAVLLVDADTRVILYRANDRKKIYPASLTKIITALTAKRLFDLDEVVEVKRVIEEGRVMGLYKGERIRVENLIYGILIHSANDAAFALADAYGYDKFINQMNQTAQSFGMRQTNFTNPAGFDDPNHYSTAYDLYLASEALLADAYLKKIVGIREITVSDEDYRVFHTLVNVNRLLGEIPGVAGIKTGYTPNAGENLISLYKTRSLGEILLVVVGSQDRFKDTEQIINWLNQGLRIYNLNL